MWQLIIRIKKNDEVGGKRLQTLIMDCLMKAKVSGATVWTGVNGFGKRGKSTLHLEGVIVNMPLIIEVVSGRQRISNRPRDFRNLKNILASLLEIKRGRYCQNRIMIEAKGLL
jgi:PII-like signaling protein